MSDLTTSQKPDHRASVLERFTRQSLTPETITAIEEQTGAFRLIIEDVLRFTKPGRERFLALTALEEARFWANQALALNGVNE